MSDHEIRVRSWVRATEAEVRGGLLGYLSVLFGDLVVDGITLRQTAEGKFALSYPARTDRAGRRHAYVRPVDDAARRAIERELLRQFGQGQDLEVAEEEQP